MNTRICLVLCLGAFLSAFFEASASTITFQKIFGRWKTTPTNYNLGKFSGGSRTIACNESWIAVGNSRDSDVATSAGSVQIYNTTTGAFVRKILPPPSLAPVVLSYFGSSCALSGNTLLVGAANAQVNNIQSGVAFLYDVLTGKLLHTLLPSVRNLADSFGSTVAITDGKAIVSARTFGGSDDGAVFIFDLATGVELQKLDGASAAEFGWSLAAEGKLLLVGARKENNATGAAHLYDLTTFAKIKSFVPSIATTGDEWGYAVALDGATVVMSSTWVKKIAAYAHGQSSSIEKVFASSDSKAVGFNLEASDGIILTTEANTNSAGRLYLFDLKSNGGTEMLRIDPPDVTAPDQRFGMFAAMHGSTIVAAADGDSTQASGAGAAYILRKVTRELGLTKVAGRGEFAPGAVDISFGSFSNVGLNSDGEVAFTSTLTGAGSGGGKDTGAWNRLSGSLDLSIKSRQALGFGGINTGAVSQVLINGTSNAWIRCSLSGTGITRANNQIILQDNGASVSGRLQVGETIANFSNDGTDHDAAPSAIQAMVQGRDGRLGTVTPLKLGMAGTTALNDSAFTHWDSAGTFKTEREDETVFGTALKYGQFSPRLACLREWAVYSAALQAPTASNAAIFRRSFNTNEVIVAQKGQPAPAFDSAQTLTGLTFNTFLGECTDETSTVLYRATLAGPGVTTANNEGIWSNTGTTRLIFRKGQDLGVNAGTHFLGLPQLAGVKIAQFINYWQCNGQPLALVRLTGTKVTPANDVALLLFQTTTGVANQLMVLMREGESAPGCNGAVVSTIQRVEVEPGVGQYVVQAALGKTSTGLNQAMFTGYTNPNHTDAALNVIRHPRLLFRKGSIYDNQPSPIKSFSLPASNLPPSGAGGTGLNCALAPSSTIQGRIVLTIEFANGVRQIMTGLP